MKPEQQRIAIAEACGKWHSGWPHEYMNQADRLRHIPDYLNDLNAMHEAEKMLGACWPTYCEHLLEIVEPEPRSLEVCHYWNLLHATATQRAEAFLRTIGKWEEAK